MKALHKGDRVLMTPECWRQRLGKFKTGTVASEPQSPERVSVLIDGRKTATLFARSFWRKAKTRD